MFFIYSRCKFLIQYMICRYLLPFCSCLFTCLIVSLEAQNFLILMVSAFFFATLFFNWRIIAYRLLLFSVRHQQESSRGTPMSPPSRACLPTPFPPRPSRLSQSPCLSPLRHAADSHWLSVLRMAAPIVLSTHLPRSSLLPVPIGLFSMTVSQIHLSALSL